MWRGSSFSVVGIELLGDLKSVALLTFDVALTVGGSVPGFSVSHSEQIVCVHAAVCSCVAGDRLTVHLPAAFLIHSEELVHGILLSLGRRLSRTFCSTVKLCGVGLEGLVLNDSIAVFVVAAPVLADGIGSDGPSVGVLSALHAHDFGNGGKIRVGVVDEIEPACR